MDLVRTNSKKQSQKNETKKEEPAKMPTGGHSLGKVADFQEVL